MPSADQIDLNSLTIFDAVAAAGSFTAAADRLGVAKARISVQVARLERQLGVALFARTTRQVSLTDAGRALHAQCQPLLRSLNEALSQAASTDGELSGVLRISSTVLQAAQSIAPALAAFAALHPRLQVDLRSADRVADMVGEGIDLSFRMGWLRDSSERAIKLGEFAQHVVAAPSYLKLHGRPTRPEQLARHAWIALSLLAAPRTWKFSRAGVKDVVVHMNARIQADSPSTLLALLEGGAGISVLEEMTLQGALARGALVKLLPAWSLARGGLYAVLPPGRHVPPQVRAFIDFYRAWLGR